MCRIASRTPRVSGYLGSYINKDKGRGDRNTLSLGLHAFGSSGKEAFQCCRRSRQKAGQCHGCHPGNRQVMNLRKFAGSTGQSHSAPDGEKDVVRPDDLEC